MQSWRMCVTRYQIAAATTRPGNTLPRNSYKQLRRAISALRRWKMLHVVPYAIWPAKRWRDEIGLSCCPLDPPHTSPVRSRKCALRAPGRSSLKRSVPELKPYDRDQNLKASSSCAGGPSLRDLISPVRLGDRTALAGFRPQSVSAFHHRLADEFLCFHHRFAGWFFVPGREVDWADFSFADPFYRNAFALPKSRTFALHYIRAKIPRMIARGIAPTRPAMKTSRRAGALRMIVPPRALSGIRFPSTVGRAELDPLSQYETCHDPRPNERNRSECARTDLRHLI